MWTIHALMLMHLRKKKKMTEMSSGCRCMKLAEDVQRGAEDSLGWMQMAICAEKLTGWLEKKMRREKLAVMLWGLVMNGN